MIRKYVPFITDDFKSLFSSTSFNYICVYLHLYENKALSFAPPQELLDLFVKEVYISLIKKCCHCTAFSFVQKKQENLNVQFQLNLSQKPTIYL